MRNQPQRAPDTPLPLSDSGSKSFEQLQDEELIDFVRDTVTRLNILADRLEVYATAKVNERGAETDA